MRKVRVKKVKVKTELKKAFAIRLRVFVREQGVPREIELDSDDEKAMHLLAFVQRKAVGTARVVVKARAAKIGRMAVLKSCRGRGIGKELLKRALKLARTSGVDHIYLHAQVSVIGFYENFGFRPQGRVFMEAGIPHRKMIFKGTTE
jgi:predicted GNAT family N-acyltransferase